MSARRRFPPRVVSLLAGARMLRIRAGTGDHRFTGVWFVLMDGRLLVRPWNDEASGWRRAFLREPRGALLVDKREIAVRARSVRGERLLDAMDRAYAAKYSTPASRKWVRGFRLPRRRRTTMELSPR
jgi:hypothetical protein